MSIIHRASQKLKPQPRPGVTPVRAEGRARNAPDVQSPAEEEILLGGGDNRPEFFTEGRRDVEEGRSSIEFPVNFKRLKRLGFITPDNRRTRTSEEFRLIKRRLMQRMTLTRKETQNGRMMERRGREHVILVTSSRPDEGKSFIATNLALSIALDEGYNVLLIDGDVMRPTQNKIFGLKPNLPGLTDLLLDMEEDLADVLLRTGQMPLSILPAGGQVATATDLFGGDEMDSFVKDIAGRYSDRIIIFDAPPLLASTEPAALAEHAGQIVMVIDAEKTSRAAVNSALDLLDSDEKVNLVLNKTALRNRTEQFGSYYDAYNDTSY